MRTRLSTILLACSAIAGAAMLSGCSKASIFSHSGEAIRFTAASGGGYTTKTVYGKDSGTKQALDWVNDDEITIASPQAKVIDGANADSHASDYVVKDVITGVPSTASVSNKSGNGLTWTDGVDSFDFYAVYPKMRDGLTLDPATGLVTASIPAQQNLTDKTSMKYVKVESQENDEGKTVNVITTVESADGADYTYTVYAPDMNYAYMTAATKGVSPSEETNAVSLTFNPAFTAFEFNVSSQDEGEIELIDFELCSPNDGNIVKRNDKLAGEFTMTAGADVADGVDVDDNAGQSIKVNMGDAKTIDDKNGLTFTVFAIPVANEEPLRLRFTSNEGDGTKTSWIDMAYGPNATEHTPGDPVVFEAGHKYRINMLKLPSSQWKITIKPIFEEWIPAEEEVTIYI